MIRLDRAFLESLGLGSLTASQANDLLGVLYQILEMRVGTEISSRMTAEQMSAFEEARDEGEQAALDYLNDVVPEHSTIARQHFNALQKELSRCAPSILARTGEEESATSWSTTALTDDTVGDGPILVEAEDGWVHLLGVAGGRLTVAVPPHRRALYSWCEDDTPAVLRLPLDFVVDPSTLWLIDGELRARLDAELDLRWRLPAEVGAAVLDPEVVSKCERPKLRLVPTYASGERFVRDDLAIVPEDRTQVDDARTGRSIRLQDWDPTVVNRALRTHVSPSGEHLVGLWRDRPPGLRVCSTSYLAECFDADSESDLPWEITREIPVEPGENPSPLGIGYDPQGAHAAVVADRHVHLLDTSDWSFIGRSHSPAHKAIVDVVDMPEATAPSRLVWSGSRILVVNAVGHVSALDLQGKSYSFEPLVDLGGAPVSLDRLDDGIVAVMSDRSVHGLFPSGELSSIRLAGDERIVAAAAVGPHRLLIATGSALELWDRGERLDRIPHHSAAIAGLTPCTRSPAWALAWHDDQSVTTVRLRSRSIHLQHDWIPHRPKTDLLATNAVMEDVDRWALVHPGGQSLADGDPFVALPDRWVQCTATSLAFLGTSDLLAIGTTNGVNFSAPREEEPPCPIDLGAVVEVLAAAPDAMSLAAASATTVWMVRLLV